MIFCFCHVQMMLIRLYVISHNSSACTFKYPSIDLKGEWGMQCSVCWLNTIEYKCEKMYCILLYCIVLYFCIALFYSVLLKYPIWYLRAL